MEGGPPSFPRDFPCPAVLRFGRIRAQRRFRLRGCHPLWPTLPGGSALALVRTPCRLFAEALTPVLQPPKRNGRTLARLRFGLRPVRSPLLGASRLISFPRGTEMFQFPRFPPTPYRFRCWYPDMTPGRLPDSGSHGSQPVDGSPRLVAACHALRRLLTPRHPPCALSHSAPRSRAPLSPRVHHPSCASGMWEHPRLHAHTICPGERVSSGSALPRCCWAHS